MFIEFTLNGHPYTFDFLGDDECTSLGLLTDSENRIVAKYEPPTVHDEYRYMIDYATDDVMLSEHENDLFGCPVWEMLAGQYEAFNS